MACVSEQERYQQWLAQINHVCGRFNARPLGEFFGELETSYARSLKLSTVTAGGLTCSAPVRRSLRAMMLVLYRVPA